MSCSMARHQNQKLLEMIFEHQVLAPDCYTRFQRSPRICSPFIAKHSSG